MCHIPLNMGQHGRCALCREISLDNLKKHFGEDAPWIYATALLHCARH